MFARQELRAVRENRCSDLQDCAGAAGPDTVSAVDMLLEHRVIVAVAESA